jgi:2-polyprenyl-6-methoxyphenol hydroxylase-like FAD-dependent oxidoreductase
VDTHLTSTRTVFWPPEPRVCEAIWAISADQILVLQRGSWWHFTAVAHQVGRRSKNARAAHPMTPFLGQGACIAIKDAMVLGRAFAAASSFEEAFATYESTRRDRANGVQLASRQQADENQGVTKRGANPGANADDRGLYLYNPVTVPLTSAPK